MTMCECRHVCIIMHSPCPACRGWSSGSEASECVARMWNMGRDWTPISQGGKMRGSAPTWPLPRLCVPSAWQRAGRNIRRLSRRPLYMSMLRMKKRCWRKKVPSAPCTEQRSGESRMRRCSCRRTTVFPLMWRRRARTRCWTGFRS